MQMDTERWKTLLTAIDKGSLCAAAEELDYTVSGVSRSVATLEKEMGFPLLYCINSNFNDPNVRHLAIDPPEIIEIGIAYRDAPAPAAEAFLKFIKEQLP